jgi:hypothetical protein
MPKLRNAWLRGVGGKSGGATADGEAVCAGSTASGGSSRAGPKSIKPFSTHTTCESHIKIEYLIKDMQYNLLKQKFMKALSRKHAPEIPPRSGALSYSC